MKTPISEVGFAVVALVLFSGLALADDIYWTAGTGDWSNPANWNLGRVPNWNYPDEYVYINNSGIAQLASPNYGFTNKIFLGVNAGEAGTIKVPGGTLYTSWFTLGDKGYGQLDVSGGGYADNSYCIIGSNYGSTGKVTVDGVSTSMSTSVELTVGHAGNGTLRITNGAHVTCRYGRLAFYDRPSVGRVTVDGPGSTWTNTDSLNVGGMGSGILTITNGGLVSIGGRLNIDTSGDPGDSSILISSGGMLAVEGQADGSITAFLDLVSPYQGTDAVQYWNGSEWDNIANATQGVDYTLHYSDGTDPDLPDHTVLTVTAVPEPTTLALLVASGMMLKRRRGKSGCVYGPTPCG